MIHRTCIRGSLLLLAICGAPPFLGCATQKGEAPGPKVKVRLHTKGAWTTLRAQLLGISADQAALRDGAISDQGPPSDVFWDEPLALEAASVWRAVCNECHGGRRRIEDATKIPAPPPGWGTSRGRFFDREREHKEVFQAIFLGPPPRDGKRSQMPNFGEKLSREQIWGLVFYLEYQSGGLGNRAPDSDLHLEAPAAK